MKRILVAPLDWGLGHASRCIPIIRYLLEKNCEVIIGAGARPLALLKSEFPALRFIEMPGYNIRYPAKGSMPVKMAFSLPRILSGIKREHRQLQQIIRNHKINAVISDNRFGLWSQSVPCVFITHQLMIKSPFGEKILHSLNKSYISKYTECWIPDYEGPENLSGDLSHRFLLPGKARFIGPLSRFAGGSISTEEGTGILAILSGPEPQRSILEKKIIDQLTSTNHRALLVQGITEKKETKELHKNLCVVSYLASAELEKEIRGARVIISRPGYSTVMDLAALAKKNIIFIPTPGQTEQEYLGALLEKKNIAFTANQADFNLEYALKKIKDYSGFKKEMKSEGFKAAVDELLEKTGIQARA